MLKGIDEGVRLPSVPRYKERQVNRAHVLLFWASATALAVATLVAFGAIDSDDLAGWVLLGACLFAAAHAARDT